MKKHLSTIILILILFAGLSLLLYPSVSDYWNSLHQSKAIATYMESMGNVDNEAYKTMLEGAEAYNEALKGKADRWKLTEEERAEYNSLLDIDGTGAMGYIEIPKIKCTLLVYHGTEEKVLQTAIGHLEGSSLPIGGGGTHCVLSGHRGLPSAKLFTNLDQLEVGDTFLLRIMDETLTYEVDQIRIVEPYDLSELEIVEGQDLCTLVTCTPYGVNTHRMLVRGHRVDTVRTAGTVRVPADAVQVEPVLVAPVFAAPILIILFILLLLTTRRRTGEREKDGERA